MRSSDTILVVFVVLIAVVVVVVVAVSRCCFVVVVFKMCIVLHRRLFRTQHICSTFVHIINGFAYYVRFVCVCATNQKIHQLRSFFVLILSIHSMWLFCCLLHLALFGVIDWWRRNRIDESFVLYSSAHISVDSDMHSLEHTFVENTPVMIISFRITSYCFCSVCCFHPTLIYQVQRCAL